MPNDGTNAGYVRQDVVDAALAGLLAPRKTLPPRLFYDPAGCGLFQRITELPEYYLTRTELALLRDLSREITAGMPGGMVLVEYGASDETKAAFLLRERNGGGKAVFTAYVPIDVARDGLIEAQTRLARSHPDLQVLPLVADFLNTVTLPGAVEGKPRFGFFPGSTIGNLEPAEARNFLARIRTTLGSGARLLIGVDLRKDPAILIPAYNDPAGITAAFNRNILVRLNREAGADFDVHSFRHAAIWNPTDSRIEMHLISECDQIVHFGRTSIRFAATETIHTENSYKYTIENFAALADHAAWRVRNVWTDAANLFSAHFLEAA